MRTEVHIVARVGRSPRISASGGLAVRQTGIDAVHLISTAATPLGGDEVEIRVEVERGACLRVSSVAAMIALPSRVESRSSVSWSIDVDADAHLAITPSPTVVAAHAELITTTMVRAEPTASLEIDERVQIGRHDETGGRWAGRLHVDVGGEPALRHQLRLDGGDAARRAVISTFCRPDTRPAAVSAVHLAARLTLAAGGTLTTAAGASLAHASAAVGDLG